MFKFLYSLFHNSNHHNQSSSNYSFSFYKNFTPPLSSYIKNQNIILLSEVINKNKKLTPFKNTLFPINSNHIQRCFLVIKELSESQKVLPNNFYDKNNNSFCMFEYTKNDIVIYNCLPYLSNYENIKYLFRGKNSSIFIYKNPNYKNLTFNLSSDSFVFIAHSKGNIFNFKIETDDQVNTSVLIYESFSCIGIYIKLESGTSVTVHKNCLFSTGITFRTGDSHTIIDSEGKKLNSPKSIFVGEHVWMGNGVSVLKGATIGNNSVIGTHAVVPGKIFESNIALAGNPAKVVKQNINWNIKKYDHYTNI